VTAQPRVDPDGGRIHIRRAVHISTVYILSGSFSIFFLETVHTFAISVSIMATRRISAVCIANTGYRSLPLLPRNPTLRGTRVPVARYLSTSQIRYKHEANTKVKRDPAPTVVRGVSKLFKDADSAVADLTSGSTILSAGFGLCGTAGEETVM
jgi:hypothetical protein